MKKIILSIAAILALTVSAVFADGEVSVSTDPLTYEINVTAQLGSRGGARTVSLVVASKGYVPDETQIPDDSFAPTDKIVSVSSAKSAADGTCVFGGFKLDAPSDDYDIYISYPGAESAVKTSAFLVSEAECREIMQAVSSGTEDEIYTVFEERRNALSSITDASVYYGLSESSKKAVCKRLKADAPFADLSEICTSLVKESVLEDILTTDSGAKLKAYFYGESSLSTAAADAAKDILQTDAHKDISAMKYLDKMSDSEKSSIFAKTAARTRADVDSLYGIVYISVWNAKATAVTSWNEVESLIADMKDDVLKDLDYTKYNNSQYKSEISKNLTQREFSDPTELCTYINNYTPGGSGSGSGGSFGGGGGGSKNTGSSAAIGIGGTTANQPSAPSADTAFADMTGNEWALDAVSALSKLGIVNGTGDNKFSPNDSVKREEFVKMLVIAMKINSDGGDVKFADIDDASWEAPYVYAAANAGVTSGIGNGLFGKGENISRQDMAVMIAAFTEGGADGEQSGFADADDIAPYAADAVAKMRKSGIINGFEDGSFRPNDNCTRAQAAAVIYKLLKFKGMA